MRPLPAAEHVLPEGRAGERAQGSGGGHVENDGGGTAVHDTVEIGVALVDEELVLDGAGGRRVDEFEVLHHMLVEVGCAGFRGGDELVSALGF